MAKLERHIGVDFEVYLIDCPACGIKHGIHTIHPTKHTHRFNGDHDRPTFAQPVVVRYQPNREAGADGRFLAVGDDVVCRFMLIDGVLHFHNDSTHVLAGKNVTLEDQNG